MDSISNQYFCKIYNNNLIQRKRTSKKIICIKEMGGGQPNIPPRGQEEMNIIEQQNPEQDIDQRQSTFDINPDLISEKVDIQHGGKSYTYNEIPQRLRKYIEKQKQITSLSVYECPPNLAFPQKRLLQTFLNMNEQQSRKILRQLQVILCFDDIIYIQIFFSKKGLSVKRSAQKQTFIDRKTMKKIDEYKENLNTTAPLVKFLKQKQNINFAPLSMNSSHFTKELTKVLVKKE